MRDTYFIIYVKLYLFKTKYYENHIIIQAFMEILFLVVSRKDSTVKIGTDLLSIKSIN